MENDVNIFLIEDDDLDAEIFERGLRKAKAAVSLTRAKDGIEALDMLKGEAANAAMPQPCIILLDINMPRMNGHEFLAAVRADETLTAERVFVFTTSSNRRDIDRAYANNASGYIVKPERASDLKDVLEMLHKYWDLCEHPTRKAPRALTA